MIETHPVELSEVDDLVDVFEFVQCAGSPNAVVVDGLPGQGFGVVRPGEFDPNDVLFLAGHVEPVEPTDSEPGGFRLRIWQRLVPVQWAVDGDLGELVSVDATVRGELPVGSALYEGDDLVVHRVW